MTTLPIRPLFSILAALACAQLGKAADSVQYSPAATTLQGVEPYSSGPRSIVITPPKLAAGTYSITLTVTATPPSGLAASTAVGFVTLGGTGVILSSPGVYTVPFKYDSTGANGAASLSVTFSQTVPVGNYVGSYTYSVVASGWPAKDSAGNAITAASAVVSATIAAPTPTISVAYPAAGQSFTVPTGQTTVQVPYDIEGTTVSGSTIATVAGSLVNGSGAAVSGFSPMFYGLNTAAVTTNIGTAGSRASVALAPGTYTLSASDTNNLGGTAKTATSVTFTVVSPSLPTISITSPANGQVFSANGGTGTASVPFAITGAASSGTIASATASMVLSGTTTSVVGFPTAFTGVGTSSASDKGTANLAPGSYTLNASDTSSSGGVTSAVVTAAPVTFTVLGAPTISISAPASGQVFEIGASGTAAVSYSILGATPSGSSFASGSAASASLTSSTGASTAGFSAVFSAGSASITSSGSVSLAPGTYTLAASDTNNLGGTTSASSTFTVVGLPTLSITAPASGQVFEVGAAGTASVAYSISGTTPAGTTFTTASAASATLSSSVPLGSSLKSSFTVGASSTSISSSGTLSLAPGAYTLAASETNNLGGTASASSSFTVVGLPSISIGAPISGASFKAGSGGSTVVSYSITATAPAGSSLKSATATLTLNGAAVSTFVASFPGLPAAAGATVTSSTAAASLTLTPGAYALSATVTDIRGGTASTGPVTFTVVQAPVVTISAPVSGATIAIVNGVTTAPVAYSISAAAPSGSTFPSASSASASLTASGGGPASAFAPVFTLAGGSGSVSSSGTANLGPGSYTLNASATNNLGVVGTASPVSFTVTAPPTTTTSSVSATFNSSSIAKGNTLWFSGVIKVQGVPAAGTSVLLSNATVSFISSGKNVTVAVPPAVIDFASSATTATSTYDTTSNTWTTTVPANYTGNIFLSGVAYQATATIQGSLSNVTWTGTFSAANAGITAQWQWGAANYSSFTTSPGSLGVKPVDDNKTSQYKTTANAGTPENFLSYVTSGGTGAGGTSTTGSYVSSAQFILPDYNL